MATASLSRRPLTGREIDLLIKDIRCYPDLIYINKSQFQTYKNAYVVEENGRLVGICAIYKMTDNWIKLGPLVFLHNHRGKGYGKLVLNQIVSDHTDNNIFISSSNIAVQKIIAKLNFQEVVGFIRLPKIVQLFLIQSLQEYLHVKLFTEFLRKLFSMKRGVRKYYIKIAGR